MKERASMLISIVAVLGEIFMFTFCCQTLSQEVVEKVAHVHIYYRLFHFQLQKVAVSVYNIDWMDYPISMKKDLVFLIKVLQKPYHITAGKMFHLNLTFFMGVSIVNVSNEMFLD